VISARAKGVSTVPVPLVVPGVQDPDDPDLLDHLPGAHRYLAAPVQRGASRRQNPGVPAPFGPNWPGPAVAATLASLGHLTKGELCREQALVFRCSHPSDTQTWEISRIQALLEHAGVQSTVRRAVRARPCGEAAMTAAPLIAPLIPPATSGAGGRKGGRTAAARRLPLAAVPEVPAVPDDVRYGFGRMDEWGRVADRAVIQVLG
jgi:hypothetical protein